VKQADVCTSAPRFRKEQLDDYKQTRRALARERGVFVSAYGKAPNSQACARFFGSGPSNHPISLTSAPKFSALLIPIHYQRFAAQKIQICVFSFRPYVHLFVTGVANFCACVAHFYASVSCFCASVAQLCALAAYICASIAHFGAYIA
jgi:hypothetical protein